MKKIYDVIWSETSEKDLMGIVEYIAADSPSNAFEIFKKIKQKASRLYTFPDRGRIVSELQDQGIILYRELIVPHGESSTGYQRKPFMFYLCWIQDKMLKIFS